MNRAEEDFRLAQRGEADLFASAAYQYCQAAEKALKAFFTIIAPPTLRCGWLHFREKRLPVATPVSRKVFRPWLNTSAKCFKALHLHLKKGLAPKMHDLSALETVCKGVQG